MLAGQKKRWGNLHAVYDVGPPTPTRLLRRGEHLAPRGEVPPSLVRVLSAGTHLDPRPPHAGASGRRLALARRLTDFTTPAGALLARVHVNRVWQHLFGRGLVATPDNLGESGARPSHPALLDWIAAEFSRSGSLKAILKLLMTSTAYRQASAVPKGPGDQHDPDNLLLWRMPLKRLESEVVRDALLSVSGELDRAPGGPPVREEVPRRSLYLLARRNYHPALLSAFDQPTLNAPCVARSPSAVVAQALSLLNDPFVQARAEAFAARVLREAPGGEHVERAFRLALGRPPRPDESAAASALLARHTERYRTDQAGRAALTHLCHMLFNTSEFLHAP
jgi:hypothetical protein